MEMVIYYDGNFKTFDINGVPIINKKYVLEAEFMGFDEDYLINMRE